jgi:hypothetical protein
VFCFSLWPPSVSGFWLLLVRSVARYRMGNERVDPFAM